MAKSVKFPISFKGSNIATVDKFPDECPFCHDKITPMDIGSSGANVKEEQTAKIVFLCPGEDCKEIFIGYYQLDSGYEYDYRLLDTSQGYPISQEFHKSINVISPAFIEIYNEAFEAEQQNLHQICGVGYRKALEFLIKDFAKYKNTDKEKIRKIESIFLGDVIKTYLEDKKIKTVAERAAWLGNDHTHYIKKWGNKDLSDLKMLIDLTVAFIQQDYDYEELLKSMPE